MVKITLVIYMVVSGQMQVSRVAVPDMPTCERMLAAMAQEKNMYHLECKSSSPKKKEK